MLPCTRIFSALKESSATEHEDLVWNYVATYPILNQTDYDIVLLRITVRIQEGEAFSTILTMETSAFSNFGTTASAKVLGNYMNISDKNLFAFF